MDRRRCRPLESHSTEVEHWRFHRRPPRDVFVAAVTRFPTRVWATIGRHGLVAEGDRILVAVSGGVDSVVLLHVLAALAPQARARLAGVVHVHHGLRGAEADADASFCEQLAASLGIAFDVVHVDVAAEAARRRWSLERTGHALRHAAFRLVARRRLATRIAVGHTLDDQAETVLLGLARGSGTASLAGMAPSAGRYVRPLLGIRRATTRQACLDAGLTPWDDPHNTDPGYARVRVRERVLPVLEAELGPGVAEALARTAEQLREDDEAFTSQIDEFIEEICEPAEAGIAVSVGALAANPAALRQRIIRHVVASEFGVSLSRTQTLEVARLVTAWHGQGPIDLPGGIRSRREQGLILFQNSGEWRRR
jgi:tRNA(Ile)-lysidine synthase